MSDGRRLYAERHPTPPTGRATDADTDDAALADAAATADAALFPKDSRGVLLHRARHGDTDARADLERLDAIRVALEAGANYDGAA